MATKVLGFIELVWTCDSCGTKNPGPIKSCTACGAPQPPNVQFEKVDAESFDFIKDQALIRMAQIGADKHCPYCGTRNVADAATCVECGSDITVGAQTRDADRVMDQPASELPSPVTPARKMPTGVIVFIAIVLLAICLFVGMYLTKMNQTEAITGTVSAAGWQRSVEVLGYRQIETSDWKDTIPAGSTAYNCTLRYRYDSETEVPNSKEVCGEPYTVDTGTGVGRVQQDCIYQVYEDYCSYQTMTWTLIDTLAVSGSDLSPYWPETQLTSNEKFGKANERYTIVFTSDGTSYQLTTSDFELYQYALPGSQWTLEVNSFGDVRNASPAP
ncbi:MAG: zinc finger protein [Anaerolineaceae bacterium]